jgi:hypothetical protein
MMPGPTAELALPLPELVLAQQAVAVVLVAHWLHLQPNTQRLRRSLLPGQDPVLKTLPAGSILGYPSTGRV